MDILELIITIALILLPLGELVRITLTDTIAINFLDIIVAVTVVIWLIKLCIQKRKIEIKNQKYFLIFSSIAVISLIINSSWLKPQEILASFLYLIRWISYTGIYFVVAGLETKRKIYIEKLMYIAGFIFVLCGYFQYFFYPNLNALFYLGWDKHMYRMFSNFLDPNFAGAFFVLYLIFLCRFIHFPTNLSSGKAWKNLIKQATWFEKMTNVLFALTLIAIFLTFSRSALLMLITSGSMYLLLINKKKLILALLGIIAIAILIISPFFHIENMNLLRTNSSMGRLESSQTAIKIFLKNPIIGVGFNTYRYAQLKYHFRRESPYVPSHADAGTDNSFLFVLATTGIIGFIAYLSFWKTIMQHIYQSGKNKKNELSKVAIASFTGLIINAFFINSLFYPPILLWIYILLAL